MRTAEEQNEELLFSIYLKKLMEINSNNILGETSNSKGDKAQFVVRTHHNYKYENLSH